MKNSRPFLLSFAFILVTLSSSAQYYYKDIVSNKETEELIKVYMASKVTAVRLVSYDGEGVKSDDISMEQRFSTAEHTLRTSTKSEANSESVLLSYFNEKGQVIKTVDSTEAATSVTTYQYNAGGQLQTISTLLNDSTNALSDREEHRWEYKDGKVSRLLRIKNGNDTATVQFKLDEAGNVIEERSTRRGIQSEPLYYYYDSQNRLTDIVRYNSKLKKLLPEYMFEYSASNQVIQRITVPGTGSNYLIWRYQYDDRGLKTKEAIYDKYKKLNGKVEYLYSLGS